MPLNRQGSVNHTYWTENTKCFSISVSHTIIFLTLPLKFSTTLINHFWPFYFIKHLQCSEMNTQNINHETKTTFLFKTLKTNSWLQLIWTPVTVENKLVGGITLCFQFVVQLCDCCEANSGFYTSYSFTYKNINFILSHKYWRVDQHFICNFVSIFMKIFLWSKIVHAQQFLQRAACGTCTSGCYYWTRLSCEFSEL
jgi:hypothetical protein